MTHTDPLGFRPLTGTFEPSAIQQLPDGRFLVVEDEGEEKKSRERLVRFRIEGEQVSTPMVVGGLKRALTSRHPVLAEAATVRAVKTAPAGSTSKPWK